MSILLFWALLLCIFPEVDSCGNAINFEDAMNKALAFNRQNQRKDANECLSLAIKYNPKHEAGYLYLGENRMLEGKLEEAEKLFKKGLQMKPDHVIAMLMLANLYSKKHDHKNAQNQYRLALQIVPEHPAALVNLGISLKETQLFDEAESVLQKAIELHPSLAEAHYALGEVIYSQNRENEAIPHIKNAIKVRPDFTAAMNFLILCLERQHDPQGALNIAEQGLKTSPRWWNGKYQRSRLLRMLGRLNEAEKSFQDALNSPEDLSTYDHISYAYNEYGHLLLDLKRDDEALQQYRYSVQVEPTFAEGWVNIGARIFDFEETKRVYENALAIKPTLYEAWVNLGQNYYNHFRKNESYIGQAMECATQAITVAPTKSSPLYFYMRIAVDICDWDNYDRQFVTMSEFIIKDLAANTLLDSSLSPVHCLVYPLDDALVLQVYRRKSDRIHQSCNLIMQQSSLAERTVWDVSQGLVVGYVSADFREHPVARLFQSVPKLHNRKHIKVVCFDIHNKDIDDSSPLRKDIAAACDHFVDIHSLSHVDAVDIIRSHNVSILVDLAGLTQDGRLELFALRGGFMSLSFLGFASSTQSKFIDHVTADATASPPEYASSFTEKLILLPRCYYVTNHMQSISTLKHPSSLPAVTKIQLGIAPFCIDKFLFASFNQPFKITPKLWETWMRILKRVPASCLWLLKLNEGVAAEEHLRKLAENHGIAQERLYFTGSADADVHIQYKSTADLLLDTWVYNGHSTVVDTLWGGVPIVTVAGSRMASRIASSIALGIAAPWMIARTVEEYEDIAVACALKPVVYANLRNKMISNRLSSNLFKTDVWVKRWEAALKMTWDIFISQNGHQLKPTVQLPLHLKRHIIVFDDEIESSSPPPSSSLLPSSSSSQITSWVEIGAKVYSHVLSSLQQSNSQSQIRAAVQQFLKQLEKEEESNGT